MQARKNVCKWIAREKWEQISLVCFLTSRLFNKQVVQSHWQEIGIDF